VDPLRGYGGTPSGTPSTHAHPGKGQLLGGRWFWRKSSDTGQRVFASAQVGQSNGHERGSIVTKMIAFVLKGGYFMGYSALGLE
jgi:hypothetical protein